MMRRTYAVAFVMWITSLLVSVAVPICLVQRSATRMQEERDDILKRLQDLTVHATLGSSDAIQDSSAKTATAQAFLEPRRMGGGLTTAGRSGGVGCYQLEDIGAQTIAVSSNTGCNGDTCPACFMAQINSAQVISLTIGDCSSATWGSLFHRHGVWGYTFINPVGSSREMIVGDGVNTHTVPEGTHIEAYCASASFGTANRFIFPSTTFNEVSVLGDFSMTSGTFTSGAVINLMGHTSVAGNLTVDESFKAKSHDYYTAPSTTVPP